MNVLDVILVLNKMIYNTKTIMIEQKIDKIRNKKW